MHCVSLCSLQIRIMSRGSAGRRPWQRPAVALLNCAQQAPLYNRLQRRTR